jgi:hypothetical protein
MKANPINNFVFVLILILTACNSVEPDDSTSMDVPGSPASLAVDMDVKRIEPEFDTHPSDSIATPTATSMTVKRSEPALSWTPQPTFTAGQARDYALNMMKTNGGCKFPCWFGITPGKTTWVDASKALSSYAYSISKPNMLRESYEVTLKFPFQSFHGNSSAAANIFVKPDGKVEKIKTLTDITLPDLLDTYGVPDEVRLLAVGVNTTDPNGHFTLVLFYPDLGFIAAYEGKNERDAVIHVCPSNITGQPEWLIWNPADPVTFSEAGKEISLISSVSSPTEKDYISIEKLIGVTPEAFHQRYKDPENTDVCMEMQAPDL